MIKKKFKFLKPKKLLIKKAQNCFVRELIDSESVYVKTGTKTTRLNSVKSNVILKNRNQVHILDIFELNTSLKQLIRILFSLKYLKPGYSSEFIIYIWTTNLFILELIELFIVNYEMSKHVLVSSLFPVVDQKQDLFKQKLLFVIGDPWLKQSAKMVDTFILPNNIFFVNTFNFTWEKQEPGFYKIQNDLSDYKKLLVLLIIMESVVNYAGFTKKKVKTIKKVKIVNKALISILNARIIKYSGVDKTITKSKRWNERSWKTLSMPLNSEFKKKLLKKSKIKYAEAKKLSNTTIDKKASGNKKRIVKKMYLLGKALKWLKEKPVIFVRIEKKSKIIIPEIIPTKNQKNFKTYNKVDNRFINQNKTSNNVNQNKTPNNANQNKTQNNVNQNKIKNNVNQNKTQNNVKKK